jgi:hypothetical protein
MVDTSLIGRAKELEVASALIRNGIYVYYPLVDTGADLVASNRTCTIFIPVQVRFSAHTSGLWLVRSDKERFSKANTVIAFLTGEGESKRNWYLPISDWCSKVVDPERRDEKVYVQISKNEEWLTRYRDDEGIRFVFKCLLSEA